MAAGRRAPKSGLLELRAPGEQWLRVLVTLSEDFLSVVPSTKGSEEPLQPPPSPVQLNGAEACALVPDSLTNIKRTVRIVKQDVGGLGISIKGKREGETGREGCPFASIVFPSNFFFLITLLLFLRRPHSRPRFQPAAS